MASTPATSTRSGGASGAKIVSLPALILKHKLEEDDCLRLKACPLWVSDGIDIILAANGKCSLVNAGGMSIDASYQGTYTIDETTTPHPTIHFTFKDNNTYGRKEADLDPTIHDFTLQYILYEEDRIFTPITYKKIYDQDTAGDVEVFDEDEFDDIDNSPSTDVINGVKITHAIHFSGDPFHYDLPSRVDYEIPSRTEFWQEVCDERNTLNAERNRQDGGNRKTTFTVADFLAKNDLGAEHDGVLHSVYYVEKRPYERVKIVKNASSGAGASAATTS